jgi:RNA polymerase sigma-70 factor (ECF subfamily)
MERPAGHDDRVDKVDYPADPSAALEQMMERHGNDVLRTAYFYMGDRHLAEDVSQEVFLRAYRHWTSFRGDSTVKTWLTKITVHLCRDRLRRKSAAETPTDPALIRLDAERAAGRNAEDEAMHRLSRSGFLSKLAELPPHYHEALYLYYYLDLSTREIAEATGTPEGTVRGRLSRARELLAERLQREELTS